MDYLIPARVRIPSTIDVLNTLDKWIGHKFTYGEFTDTVSVSGQSCTIKGSYQLIGDYCMLTAKADIPVGAQSISYNLPLNVNAVVQTGFHCAHDSEIPAVIGTTIGDGSAIRLLATSESGYFDVDEVTFTFMYPYVNRGGYWDEEVEEP